MNERATGREKADSDPRMRGWAVFWVACGLFVWLCLRVGMSAGAEVRYTFTHAGTMSPRMQHAAVLLRDGKILITGGENFSPTNGSMQVLDTAEIYDPATGQSCATGRMTSPRYSHSAVLLPNGTVLISGGRGGISKPLDSAEFYDPAKGQFFAAGRMTRPRFEHAAVLLSDGSVLLTGGFDNLSFQILPTELYDPNVGRFLYAGGEIDSPRSRHAAVTLPNGMVLLIGGSKESRDGFGLATNSIEILNPRGYPVGIGQMATPRYDHAAVLTSDGKVLIAGGRTASGLAPSVELYDPGTGKSTFAGSMTTGRAEHTAVAMRDGKILVGGGYGGPNFMEVGSVTSVVSDVSEGGSATPVVSDFTKFPPPVSFPKIPAVKPSALRTPAAPRLDIAVTDISLEPYCRIAVKVTNTGTSGINQTLRQQVWIGNMLAEDTAIGFDLPPGVSTERTVTTRMQGTNVVKVIVDADNKLLDVNRANNTLTKTLTCVGNGGGK